MQDKKVFAHLLTWFQTKDYSGKWEMWSSDYAQNLHNPDHFLEINKRDIAATSYPLTGIYDTNDSSVIEYQLLLMKMAGIDGVIVDWDGRHINTYRHEGFLSVLKELKKFDMKLIVCFEEWAGYWPVNHEESRIKQVNKAIDEIIWLYENVMIKNDYETINGRYPVMIFRKIPDYWFNEAEWVYIKEKTEAYKIDYLFNDVYDEQFSQVSDGYFTWVSGFDEKTKINTLEFYQNEFNSYMRKYQTRNKSLFFGSVMPGFDDSPVYGWGDGPRIAPRYGFDRLKKSWKNMMDYDVSYVQIVTWNDWNEGSQIEPCDKDQFAFLEETIRQISNFKNIDYKKAIGYLYLALDLFHLRNHKEVDVKALDEINLNLLQGNYDVALKKINRQKEKNNE